MKTKIIPILVSIILIIGFTSCEDANYKEYTGYKPVYMSYNDLRESVRSTNIRELENPGKIYYKDNYIFIVEELKGIHVYDNSDNSSPAPVSFVEIPGVIDIAISGYYLYADSYIDLVVLNVQDPENINEAYRLKDVLPYTVPPHDSDYPEGRVDSDKGVVLEWQLTTIKERIHYNPVLYPIFFLDGEKFYTTDAMSSGSVSGTGTGIGGSMARFGIKDDILYAVNNNMMKIFDISDPASPVKYNDFYAGWGIETMFMTEENMFLGSQTGMYIYDLSIPWNPVQISFFRHATSCDPVIVDNNLAYITLRSGTVCGSNVNTLDVVDISDLSDPELIATYPMVNPHGLGKDGDILFICDGWSGLKIYDTSDPYSITDHLIYHYPSIDAYDVIPLGDILVMIGDDGLYQYDYSSLDNITLLSSIKTSGDE